jgi:hypothetical protein
MLNKDELNRIYQHAYLPEHLPDYVAAVSGATPYLFENVLCFLRRRHLIFIGYPLDNAAADVERVYTTACQTFSPSMISIIAPKIWLPETSYEKQPSDNYYRLKLPLTSIDPAVAYMVRRAERELKVAYGKFSKEHKKIIKAFLSSRNLTPEQRHIYKHIPNYLKHSNTARLIEARKDDVLTAFNVVDTGSENYAFYLFNFRSNKVNVPGASDLLLREMVNLAQFQGKKAINLGLGIHPGIRRFKEKWGGVPFLAYHSALVQRQTVNLGGLAKKL